MIENKDNRDKIYKRVVIIHAHNFKNAGSTVDWVLSKNFGSGFIDHRDDKNMKRGQEYLGPYLQENSGIAALSTHHFRAPLPVLEKTRLFLLMMFRHPIERVRSVYDFERSQKPAITMGAKYANTHNFREYVLWRMRFDVPPTIRNFHVIRSLPYSFDWHKEATKKDLARAKDFIDFVELLGLVERFDESMVLFEETLKPFFPDVGFSYKIQNVGKKREMSQQGRVESIRREVGEDVFHLLVERNRLDLQLYEYVCELFEKRLERLSHLDEMINKFRFRCKYHEKEK